MNNDSDKPLLRNILVPRRPPREVDPDLSVGAEVIVAARLAVVVVLALFIIWVEIPYQGAAITALALSVVTHIVFWVTHVRNGKPITPVTALATIVADTVGIGVGVLLTGGVDSPMVLLWGTNVAIGAIWLGARRTLPVIGVVIAVLAVALIVDPATDLVLSGLQSAVFATFCLAIIVAHGGVVAAQQRFALAVIHAAEERARRDPLTGLLNRAALDEQILVEIDRARRYDHPLAVVMVDLDDFKQVNDTQGHLAGDAVLIDVADQLTREMRRSDVVVRFGGEEFVMLLPETDQSAAFSLAERLRQRVLDSPASQGVTLSVGVAIYPGAADGADDLIHCADRALYAAKADGKNRTVVYVPPTSGETANR